MALNGGMRNKMSRKNRLLIRKQQQQRKYSKTNSNSGFIFISGVNKFVKPVQFKCRICRQVFRQKANFIQHLSIHMGTPVSCNGCKNSFNNRIAYEWHGCFQNKRNMKLKKIKRMLLKNRHRFRCEQCKKSFAFFRHYDQHMQGHKRNNCPNCDVILTRRSDLIKHLQNEHSIKLQTALHKCQLCEKRYVKARSLYYHMREHLEANKYICMECGIISEGPESYRIHKESHENSKPFSCQKCGDKFTRKQQYEIHMRRHNTYCCQICSETFACRSRASQHLKETGHEINGLKTQNLCKQCGKTFRKQWDLMKHIESKHSRIKEIFSCEYCKKDFGSKHLYELHCKTINHEKKSPGNKELMCESCGKRFTKKYLLEQHIQVVHLKTQDYLSCEFCEFQTRNLSNLERHQDLHLATTKEFICDQCGKEFTTNAGLRDHMAYNHEQERKFKCNECPKAFKRNSELVRHLKTHSNECPHVCDLCNSAFKRTSHLKRHKLLVHKISSKSGKVQRLQPDVNGILVPIQNEPVVNKTTVKNCDPSNSLVNVNVIQENPNNYVDMQMQQHIDYFTIPVDATDNSHHHHLQLPISNKDIQVNMDQMEEQYNQSVYWSDKVTLSKDNNDLYGGSADDCMSGNEFQALNIVDQLVNSFLPDKNQLHQLSQEALYDDYANQTLQYSNSLQSVTSSDLITSTEKILQGQCDRDLISLTNQPSISEYMQSYEYMQ